MGFKGGGVIYGWRCNYNFVNFSNIVYLVFGWYLMYFGDYVKGWVRILVLGWFFFLFFIWFLVGDRNWYDWFCGFYEDC